MADNISNKCNSCKYKHNALDQKPCLGCLRNSMDNFQCMTNLEHIRELGRDEFYDWLIDVWAKLKFTFTHTEIGMKEWLDKPYEPKDEKSGK